MHKWRVYIGIHKRMAQFQKLTRNLFLTLHGYNVHRQQRQLSKFLMLYQQFAGAYCGVSFQDGVAAGKGFLCATFRRCPDLWLQCSVGFVHCNHRSGHLKTEHTESLFQLPRHLGNWPRSPAVSMSERTPGSAWETWTVAAANGVRFARVRWEINFLLTSETSPFICKHPV